MKYFFSVLLLYVFTNSIHAQLLVSRTGHINVSSENRIKKVEADNYQLFSTVDVQKGILSFEGLLKSFEFRLGAADRIFNSDRVKVTEHPKLNFEGTFNPLVLNLNEYAEHEIEVRGTLYMWGLKRVTVAKGLITTLGDGKQVFASSSFVMVIEEKSMNQANKIMKDKLPNLINVNTETLGISRNINVNLDITYKAK